MGRETKILLTLLGLLAGVFMGVVSMKLFVPRPPEGAGPDVHGDLADLETQPLVEPPDLDRPPPTASEQAAEIVAPDPYATRTSRFSQPAAVAEPDPLVQPASFQAAEPLGEIPLAEPAADLLPPASEAALPETRPPAAVPDSVPAVAEPEPPPSGFGAAQLTAPTERQQLPPAEIGAPPLPPPTQPSATLPPRDVAIDVPSPQTVMTGAGYVARPGDSWWSLAERAYGDGRFYRALFAWNRRLDPRVSLQPGTRLEIPQPDRLAAAWPTLVPRD